jgi:hypothetical protein
MVRTACAACRLVALPTSRGPFTGEIGQRTWCWSRASRSDTCRGVGQSRSCGWRGIGSDHFDVLDGGWARCRSAIGTTAGPTTAKATGSRSKQATQPVPRSLVRRAAGNRDRGEVVPNGVTSCAKPGTGPSECGAGFLQGARWSSWWTSPSAIPNPPTPGSPARRLRNSPKGVTLGRPCTHRNGASSRHRWRCRGPGASGPGRIRTRGR